MKSVSVVCEREKERGWEIFTCHRGIQGKGKQEILVGTVHWLDIVWLKIMNNFVSVFHDDSIKNYLQK